MDEQTTMVTRLLVDIRNGEPAAESGLFAIVYDELRRLAAGVMSRRAGGGSAGATLLQPTALAHEAWLKLAGNLDSIECRRHFFAVAAKAMRQVLADHARAARRQKRGGDERTVVLHSDDAVDPLDQRASSVDLVDLDEAMTKLAELNERHARVVEMRLFGSMTIQEIADMLGVSKRTIEADWSMARAWLSRELQ